MKELIIMRHAKSSWKDPELRDFERPLNKRGKRDAPFMAKILSKTESIPDLIVTSPATRAYTTARSVAFETGYPVEKIVCSEKIYEASAQDLLEVVKTFPENAERALLIGHNPGLTNFSNYLNDKRLDNLPTAAFIKSKLDIDSWKETRQDCGETEVYEFPKKYFD